jgi:hypothetical protein
MGKVWRTFLEQKTKGITILPCQRTSAYTKFFSGYPKRRCRLPKPPGEINPVPKTAFLEAFPFPFIEKNPILWNADNMILEFPPIPALILSE